MYEEALGEISAIELPSVRDGITPAWHLYPIRLNQEHLRVGRQEIFAALRAENIGVNVHYIPVHTHPYYRHRFGYKGGEYPVAEGAYQRLLSLPMYHGMINDDARCVIEAVDKVMEHYSI